MASRSRRPRGRTPPPCRRVPADGRRAARSRASAARCASHSRIALTDGSSCPSAPPARSPRRNPAVTAATTASSGSPCCLVQLGGEPHLGVDDAVSRRDRAPPRPRRVRCAASVCMTASVCSNVARYCSRSLLSAPAVNHACECRRGRCSGSVQPISSASSSTVATRNPPSR